MSATHDENRRYQMEKSKTASGTTAARRCVSALVGKTCGDCPFWIPDLDLCNRTSQDRGRCDIDVERPKRTHVRRAICERAKQYFPNTCREAREV